MIIKISKWIAEKNGCPVILKGTKVAESAKAILFKGKGYANNVYCVVCGTELTNSDSKRIGIGPVCAEKSGYPNTSYADLNDFLNTREFEIWIPKQMIEVIVDDQPKPDKFLFVDGEVFVIQVPYKYNSLAKNAQKSKWNKEKRRWEAPTSEANAIYFKNILKQFDQVDANAKGLINTLLERHERELEMTEEVKNMKYPPMKIEGIDATLFPHQTKAVMFAEAIKKFGLWAKQGTGKTLVALSIIVKLDIPKTLVICPNTVKYEWLRQFNQFNKTDKKIVILDKGTKKNKELLDGDGVYVISYESSWRLEELKDFGFNLLVIDEAHKTSATTTVQSKFIQNFDTERRIFLTGTPVRNSILDAYGVYRALNSDIFGTNKRKFIGRYAIVDEFQRVIQTINDVEFKDKYDSISLTVSLEDANLDLPEAVDLYKYIDLPSEVKTRYNKMFNTKSKIFQFKDEVKPIDNILVAVSKAQQITSGFIMDEGEIEFLHDSKTKVLGETLDEFYGEPLIVCTRFKESVSRCLSFARENGYRCAVLDGDTKDKESIVRGFQEGMYDILIGNYQVISTGLTLTHAYNMFFYDLTYSFIDYDQVKARIRRIGQTETCRYIHPVTRGTIEEKMVEALEQKLSINEYLMNQKK